MKGFKMSTLHLPPIKKVQVKRRHYRVLLICCSAGIWVVHEYDPHHEMHVAFLTNLLFAIDPTA